MAPHSRPSDPSRRDLWIMSTSPGDFFKILLFVSIVATAFKSYVVFSLREKRLSEQKNSIQEKDVKTSLQENEPISRPSAEQEAVYTTQPEDPNQRLHALRQELSQPTLKPVYPWIAPPTPLPGPYDAPYYPLPSIRRHSHDPSCESPGAQSTVPYTRRISTTSTPAQEPILRGTTTISNHGWRRTQWTVAT
ncbi:hypothetical protein CC86DRAFT_38201 [Ophiobolus disseminans]|uniref:Uncharacterized protein n=1 Tax=Ophiobolus disseminans TaxID=1469910 RepID=A0A6A6ZYT6_9PLEO|nr:hypothetical protein CC86DRAFT_38201 [Ophiobolus disseminans]